MTAPQFEEVQDSVVDLQVEWNKGSNVPVAESVTFYYNNTNGWSDVYAYAWNDSPFKQNANYPGVKMAQVKGTIYSVAIDVGYTKIQFNGGADDKKTADLTIDVTKPYYDGEWKVAPNVDAETEYYLVGSMNEWAADESYKLAADTSREGYTHSIKDVVLAADSKLKVVSTDNLWYGEHGTSDGDMTIGLEGTYDFYFNPEAAETYILCIRHVKHQLSHGIGEDWSIEDMEPTTEQKVEYVITLDLEEGEEFIVNMDGDWRGFNELKTGEGNINDLFELAGQNNVKVKEGNAGKYVIYVVVEPVEGKSIWLAVAPNE
jgi:hypothetical protein